MLISCSRGTTKRCLVQLLTPEISSQDPSLARKEHHRDLRHDRRLCSCNSAQPALLEVRLDSNGRMQHAHTFSGHSNDQHTPKRLPYVIVFDV